MYSKWLTVTCISFSKFRVLSIHYTCIYISKPVFCTWHTFPLTDHLDPNLCSRISIISGYLQPAARIPGDLWEIDWHLIWNASLLDTGSLLFRCYIRCFSLKINYLRFIWEAIYLSSLIVAYEGRGEVGRACYIDWLNSFNLVPVAKTHFNEKCPTILQYLKTVGRIEVFRHRPILPFYPQFIFTFQVTEDAYTADSLQRV